MPRRLTTLDVVLLCLTGTFLLALVGLRLFWVPTFVAMFEDFGGTLPTSTRLVLETWYAPGVAVVAVAGSSVGAVLRRTPVLLGATLVVAAALVLVLWGMYAPVFALAGAIEP